MFRVLLAIIGGAISATYPVMAQDTNYEEFKQIVQENSYTLALNDGQASGAGFDWLIEQGAEAQYFLIGERHGLAEIPTISASLFEALVEQGYRHAALEFGPFGARLAEEKLKQGGYNALEKYLTSQDGLGSIAFLDWREESEMAARIYAASGLKHGALWGLDQEFFIGFRAHLAFLEKKAKTKKQLRAIVTMRERLDADPKLLLNITPKELETFSHVFAPLNDSEVDELLRQIIFSNYIYGPWAAQKRISYAESNIRREDNMKDNFVALERAWRIKTGKPPKVFFKFGGFHSAPSFDLQNGRIMLGTFIEAYARANGHSAFNLFMECYSGARLTSGQDAGSSAGEDHSCSSYFGEIDADAPVGDRHMLSEFLDESDKFILFDLRPIRLQMDKFKFLSSEDRELITGFDAYLLIPSANAAYTYELAD
ncbi:MAG: hypothetical protein DHS20C05_21670 [Hyphococcus sp.]|nr:MAG: hypothetical protein DHS20C05_21670 [Marinicaulis sp.]